MTYTMFQEMIFYGLTGLESYDPGTKVCQFTDVELLAITDVHIEMGATSRKGSSFGNICTAMLHY